MTGVAVLLIITIFGYFTAARQVRTSAPRSLRHAEESLHRRDYAGARETLKWLLWFDPHDPHALLIAGVSLNAETRFPEAIQLLERISETSREFEQGGIALAASLILDRQLERAETVLKQVRRQFPASRDALDRLVRLYLQEFRVRDAMTVLDEYWRGAPNDLSVLPDLLELTATTAQPNEQLNFLEVTDKKHPRQFPVVLALARIHQHMGANAMSRERLQEAIALAPNDPIAHMTAAELFLDLDELSRAQSHLAQVTDLLAVMPADEDRYWFAQCRLAERKNDNPTALADVQKSLALRPNEESYLLMQATLLRRLGRSDESTIAARRAAQLATDRQQLLLLSKSLDRHQPDAAVCRAIADRFESMGEPQQAAGWRQIAETAAQLANTESVSPQPERLRSPADGDRP